MILVLIRRGNLDTDTHTHREIHVKTQGEDQHLQTKERSLRRNPAAALDLDFQPPELLETIHLCCSSLPVHGPFSWQPQETNTRCVNEGATTVGNQSSALLGILSETAGNAPQNCAAGERGGRALLLGWFPLG